MNFEITITKVFLRRKKNHNTFSGFFSTPTLTMEQSRLLELINVLSTEEKSQLMLFSALPMFNNGRMKAFVPKLLELCIQNKSAILDKQNVYEKIFPGQSFTDGKLEKVMVDAYKVVKIFIACTNYIQEENEFQQTYDFSFTIRVRGLKHRHVQSLQKLQKMQNDRAQKNVQFYHNQFLLENALYIEESYNNYIKGDLNTNNTLLALDKYYYVNKLIFLNSLLLQQKMANLGSLNHSELAILTDSTLQPYIDDTPLIKIHFKIFNILKKSNPDPSDAYILFDLLKQHEMNLDEENLRELYTYLRNTCALILNTNLNLEEFYYTLHDLYKDNLTRGYLHYEGKLHPSRYWAVSSNAVRVKDFQWALEFIEKYKHELIGENEDQDIYRLNLANYKFHVGAFQECLDLLPATSPFVDYLLIGKRMELKALYELKSELFSYKLDAFKMFLSRTSHKLLSASKKEINVEFSNLLTQIHTSVPGDKNRAERVFKRIEAKKNVSEWHWLLNKAEALKKPL